MRRGRPACSARRDVFRAKVQAVRRGLPLCRRHCLRHNDGGGRNATNLARHHQRSTRSPASELSSMAFPGGGVLSRVMPRPHQVRPAAWTGCCVCGDAGDGRSKTAGAPSSPLFMTKAMPSSQGEGQCATTGQHWDKPEDDAGIFGWNTEPPIGRLSPSELSPRLPRGV